MRNSDRSVGLERSRSWRNRVGREGERLCGFEYSTHVLAFVKSSVGTCQKITHI